MKSFLILTWILFCACGCLDQRPVKPHQQPEPIVIQDVVPIDVEPPPLTVAMPESLVRTLHEVLGNSGLITFNPTNAVKIVRPDVSVTFPKGMSFTFSLSDNNGTIKFSNPRPIIEAKAAGLRLLPYLTEVRLMADNTGVAIVKGSLYTKSVAFDLRTVGEPAIVEDHSRNEPEEILEPEPILQEEETKPEIPKPVETPQQEVPEVVSLPDSRPVVYLYHAKWCHNCPKAIAELSAKDLPFRVVLKDWDAGDPPDFVHFLPSCHWSGFDGKGRLQEGWPGMAAFLKVWKETSQKPGKDQSNTFSHWETLEPVQMRKRR